MSLSHRLHPRAPHPGVGVLRGLSDLGHPLAELLLRVRGHVQRLGCVGHLLGMDGEDKWFGAPPVFGDNYKDIRGGALLEDIPNGWLCGANETSAVLLLGPHQPSPSTRRDPPPFEGPPQNCELMRSTRWARQPQTPIKLWSVPENVLEVKAATQNGLFRPFLWFQLFTPKCIFL